MPCKLDDYEVLGKIGSGSYGTCKKIRRKKDGKILVWKQMEYGHMSESEKQMLVSEVNLLRELRHKHIVRYYDRIVDRAAATIYIVMEFCEGGDLSSLLTKHRRDNIHIEEEFIWKILVQTVQALKVCHQRKAGRAILHRDLKPANIFLDADKNVKLGDFGLARVLHHETSFAKTFVGTPYYMSPEQMNYMSYNEKSDIWSLGCMIYELTSMRPPFTASNQKELAVKIRCGRYLRIPMRYSEELNQVISRMLKVQEILRPSIDDLLCHPSIVKRIQSEDEKIPSVPSVSDPTQEDRCVKAKELALELKNKEVERGLKRRERQLDARERALELREKDVENKLSRAEKLLRDYENKKKDKVSPEILENKQPLTPCLVKTKKVNTPKKSVHFSENDAKDNFYNMGLDFDKDLNENTDELLKKDYNQILLDEELAAEKKRAELRERLYRARMRSHDLRKAELETKYRTRNLMAMRY